MPGRVRRLLGVLALAGARQAQDEIAQLGDPDPDVAYGLGQMRRRALGAVPDLIEALDDPEAVVVLEAVRALGEIGPGAEDAVPKLLEMPKARRHREHVASALRRIRGK